MVFPICFKSFPSCSDFVTLAVPLRAFCVSIMPLKMLSLLALHVGSTFSPAVVAMCSAGFYHFLQSISTSLCLVLCTVRCSPTLHGRFVCLFILFQNCFLGNCVVVCADETVFPRFGNFIALIVSDVKTRPNCVPIVVKEAIHREADRMLSLRRSLTWIAYRILKASVWPCSPRFQ